MGWKLRYKLAAVLVRLAVRLIIKDKYDYRAAFGSRVMLALSGPPYDATTFTLTPDHAPYEN